MGPFTWLVAEGCNHDISPLISPVDMVDIMHKLCMWLHNTKSLHVWCNVVLVKIVLRNDTFLDLGGSIFDVSLNVLVNVDEDDTSFAQSCIEKS